MLAASPICAGSIREWRTKLDEHGEFGITRCVECGSALVSPRPTLEHLRNLYRERGHAEHDIESLEGVLVRERRLPSCSIDAGKLFGTIIRLPGPNHPDASRRFLNVGYRYATFSRETLDRRIEGVLCKWNLSRDSSVNEGPI